MEEVIKCLKAYSDALEAEDYKEVGAIFNDIKFFGMPKIKAFVSEYEVFTAKYVKYNKLSTIMSVIGLVLIIAGCMTVLLLPMVLDTLTSIAIGVLICSFGIASQFLPLTAAKTLDDSRLVCLAKTRTLQTNLSKMEEQVNGNSGRAFKRIR